MELRETRRAGLLARVLPAIVILLATWLLLCLVQGVPVLCALANPCAAPDVRVAPALLFGALMIAPTAALVLTARGGERAWKWLRSLSYIVLAGLAVVGLGAALFSGGFTVPFVF